jgi:hypothetical protein
MKAGRERLLRGGDFATLSARYWPRADPGVLDTAQSDSVPAGHVADGAYFAPVTGASAIGMTAAIWSIFPIARV